MDSFEKNHLSLSTLISGLHLDAHNCNAFVGRLRVFLSQNNFVDLFFRDQDSQQLFATFGVFLNEGGDWGSFVSKVIFFEIDKVNFFEPFGK